MSVTELFQLCFALVDQAVEERHGDILRGVVKSSGTRLMVNVE